MRIAGATWGHPVSSAVLLEDGRVKRAAAEERFSGRKRDPSFPQRALNFVLDSIPPDLYAVAGEGMIEGAEESRLRRYPLLHSMAAASFFSSPFQKAGVLVVDYNFTAIFKGEGTRLELVEKWDFPNTLGLFCAAITQFLGYTPGEGDYKVMGLAGYGKPRMVEDLEKALELSSTGYRLNLDFFSPGGRVLFSEKLVSLLGHPPDRPVEEAVSRFADLAASAQALFERALLYLASRALEISSSRNLVLAGSQALNGAANYRLVKELNIELYVQPEAGAGGASLGAAYLAWVEETSRRPGPLLDPFLGKGYSEELRDFLERNGIKAEELEAEKLLDRTAETLADGKVVGWFQGRFEWGPRALGARSILADPRRAEMKDVVNLRIKRREPFRPFAPSVLEGRAEEFFEIPEGGACPLRFMQMVVPVKSELIPAATHVDRTARPQLVSEDFHPDFYALLKAFGDETGVPVLLNTSFNLKGKPIVASPQQALSTFLETEMDVLVLENFFVEKT